MLRSTAGSAGRAIACYLGKTPKHTNLLQRWSLSLGQRQDRSFGPAAAGTDKDKARRVRIIGARAQMNPLGTAGSGPWDCAHYSSPRRLFQFNREMRMPSKKDKTGTRMSKDALSLRDKATSRHQFVFPDTLWRAIQQVADRMGISTAEWVRDACRKELG